MEDVPDQAVQEVMQDCQHWFGLVLTSLFYKENSDEGVVISLPKLYQDWLANPITQKNFQKTLIDQVLSGAQAMKQALDNAQKNSPPTKQDFQNFILAFQEFMSRLNETENDSLLSVHGVDSLTGFKANSILMSDLKRELERRSRRGQPFTVALLRIDGGASVEERDYKLKTMAAALQQTMRGFDDVYRFGETDLLVGLKHSDIKGSVNFIERLKTDLKLLHADFTFSSCLAEPDPSDDLTVFLSNLENDLTYISTHGKGQTVKYEDLSPLQRFVAGMKDKA